MLSLLLIQVLSLCTLSQGQGEPVWFRVSQSVCTPSSLDGSGTRPYRVQNAKSLAREVGCKSDGSVYTNFC